MRDIKFRFWLGHTKKMTYPRALQDIGEIIPKFTDDIIPLQFTGLKDKNGKEIYEGDILSPLKEEVKFEVTKRGEVYGHGDTGTDTFAGFLISGWYGNLKDREVIGNIYENPELLK